MQLTKNLTLSASKSPSAIGPNMSLQAETKRCRGLRTIVKLGISDQVLSSNTLINSGPIWRWYQTWYIISPWVWPLKETFLPFRKFLRYKVNKELPAFRGLKLKWKINFQLSIEGTCMQNVKFALLCSMRPNDLPNRHFCGSCSSLRWQNAFSFCLLILKVLPKSFSCDGWPVWEIDSNTNIAMIAMKHRGKIWEQNRYSQCYGTN